MTVLVHVQAAYTAKRPSTLSILQKIVFWYLAARYLQKAFRHLYARGLWNTVQDGYTGLLRRLFSLVLLLPSAKAKVQKEMSRARLDMIATLAPTYPDLPKHYTLPAHGRSPDDIRTELDRLATIKGSDWKGGKVSGAVYYGDEGETPDVMKHAMNRFVLSNPLHPDVFPGLRKMESEVVQITLDLFNAPPDGAGTTTSGGTESICMACKTYRDWAYETKGITEPEMVVPVSAHAAFEKSAHYFRIKLRPVPVDQETRQADIKAVKRAINSNTICLVGSFPNFPDGACDDIAQLSELALRYKVGLHVDCCLGSFLVPFLEEAGFPCPPFDFRLPGVTSISCDSHKYGFTNKGVSTILYRSKELRKHQYFISTSWPGGVYPSPSLAGSRPGTLIAGAWATFMSIGRDGYLESCKQIVGTARSIETRLRREVPEVYILGKPFVSVVAFGSDAVDILEVGDRLSKKGWHLNALQNPPALHIAVTRLTVSRVDGFITDIQEAIQDVLLHPTSAKGTMTTIYGLGNSSPIGPGLVKEAAAMFIDTLFV